MLERGAFLNDTVAPKSKRAALREYGRLLIERTVFEAKDQMTRYAIAICDLCELTVSEELAFAGAQGEKAVLQAFRVADRHLFSS